MSTYLIKTMTTCDGVVGHGVRKGVVSGVGPSCYMSTNEEWTLTLDHPP
jgi:hypothetical protein